MVIKTQERRLRTRDAVSAEGPREQLVSMILGTYREMPGLRLQLAEAARLFGLRTTTCKIVLDDLVREGALCRTDEGQYVPA
jgi:DNA-binding IclR family transcriptional regulator